MSTESAHEALRELVDLKEMKDKHGKTDAYERRREAAWRRAKEALVDCFRCAVVNHLVSHADWKSEDASAVVWEDSEITYRVAIDEDPEDWAIESYCTE
jgi:hypothetical protein